MAYDSLLAVPDVNLELLLEAQEWNDLSETALRLLEAMQLDDFMLAMNVADLQGNVHNHFFGSLPKTFIAKLQIADRLETDPIARHILTSGIPLSWEVGPLCEMNSQELRYHALKELGIASGLSMAARSERSFSRIDFYSRDATTYPFKKQIQSNLFLFATYLNEATRILWAAQTPNQAPILTAREHECLKWSASGKTSQEIGLILGISQHTVYFHLKKVASKFNVYGTRHAISKAMENGIT